jgi:3-hydroxyisobutyrate dehydrogenase-like beta-hydroxyacid dehydrogenase
MKLGFIGLGHMGAGMAANLVKGGHDLSVFNRSSGRSGRRSSRLAHTRQERSPMRAAVRR